MIFNDENAPGFPVIVAMHINPTGGAEGPWAPWTGTLSVGDIEIGAVEIKDATTDTRAVVTAAGLDVHESKVMTPAPATGAAAVNMTVTPGVAAYLEQMTIHLSAAGTAGNLTITIDNGAGAAYDTVIRTQDMTAIINDLWIPPRPIYLKATDSVVIAWANASTRTYGIEVFWSAA